MTPHRIAPTLLVTALLAPGLFPATQAAAQPRAPAALQTPAPAVSGEKIVAVVNGDVITSGDVIARGRLFALSTGLPVTPEVLDRLRPQVTKQLVDERLRLQEAQRRKVIVTDKEIADAIGDIEQRNGLPSGRLADSLKGQGVALRTLIDQVRVQIGWSRVLRQELGDKTQVSDADIAEQDRIFKAQLGKPEFRLGEIFIPIDDPAHAGEAQRFADTVIAQLHQGAPFGVAAAQFSQSQTALQGGDLGWQPATDLDPAVAAVAAAMPVGAISNPIPVPGGISIVTLRAKREIGRDHSTVVHLRQAFFPFQGALNPAAPTAQQRAAVDQAAAASKSAHGCPDIEAANQRAGAIRPADPGEVRLEGIGSPALRTLITNLQPNQASQPIVSTDGVAVVMVCSREDKVAAAPSKQETSTRLVEDRAELTSRQLLRDLRRRSVLELRGS